MIIFIEIEQRMIHGNSIGYLKCHKQSIRFDVSNYYIL